MPRRPGPPPLLERRTRTQLADRQKELTELRKARSLLLILLAAARETRPALDGAAHVLETDIAADLDRIADAAEREIKALNDAIERLD